MKARALEIQREKERELQHELARRAEQDKAAAKAEAEVSCSGGKCKQSTRKHRCQSPLVYTRWKHARRLARRSACTLTH
jgi:hypothetical protein